MYEHCSNKHIGREIKVAFNLFSRFAESKANALGVTFAQGRVLHFIKILEKDGPVYHKDIEMEFNLRGSSATEMLQKLERNGLIARVEDEKDKRSKRIHVTDKGLELEKGIFSKLCEFESEIKAGLSPEDLEAFFRVLDKLRDNLTELMEEL